MGFTGGYYSTRGSGEAVISAMLVIFVLAVVLTVLAFIFIVPEKRREKLNAFGKFLHDTCNFNYLLIEKILQALYIFLTVFVILMGVYTLFHSFWAGLALTIIMPIVVRLLYEFLMMTVLLLKHVIMIDNKLKNQNTVDKKQKPADPEFVSREPKKPAPTPAPAKPAVKKVAPAAKPTAEKTVPAAKSTAERPAQPAKSAAVKPAVKTAPARTETPVKKAAEPVSEAPARKAPAEPVSETPARKAPAEPVSETPVKKAPVKLEKPVQVKTEAPVTPAETAPEPASTPVETEAPVKTAPEIQPASEAPARPRARFCTECGSRLDENGKCPNCSK